jgi:hypothetical protein
MVETMQTRSASMVIFCVLLSATRVLGESRPSMLADYLGDARSGAVELTLTNANGQSSSRSRWSVAATRALRTGVSA